MKINKIFLLCFSLIIILTRSNNAFSQAMTLNWSQQISTSGWDWVNKIIQVDNKSCLIVGGIPKTVNDSTSINNTGASDAYVAMIDAEGSLSWQKTFGSNLFDVALDGIQHYNDFYIAGLYQDTIIDSGISISPPAYQGAFLSQISASGNIRNLWPIGNNGYISNFLLSKFHSDYLIGAYKYEELVFPDSAALNQTCGNKIALMEIDTTGQQTIIKEICSTGNLSLSALEYQNNMLILSGSFSDTLMLDDTLFISSGLDDGFSICFDTNYAIKWVKTYGGNGNDRVSVVGFDNQRNIIIGGTFEESALFEPYVLTSEGNTDIFILKVDSAGIIQWHRKISGMANEECYGIALSSENEPFILGSFRNNVKFEPYPLAPGYQEYLSESGFGNLFLAKYSNTGNLIFSFTLPGTSEDFGKSIIVDSSDNIVIAGNFNIELLIQNLNSDAPAVKLSSNGDKDIFVAKFADPCLNMKQNLIQDTVICNNSSLVLDAGEGYETYMWSTGESKRSININKPGTYKVLVSNASGCTLMDSAVIKIIPDPVVFAGADTIIEASYFIPASSISMHCNDISWHCNGSGNLINSDSIYPIYFPTEIEIDGGTIELFLIGSNSCNTVESSMKIIFKPVKNGISAFPNPAVDIVKVSTTNPAENISSIDLIAPNGTIIKKWDEINAPWIDLNVKNITVGMYRLLISTSFNNYSLPLVIIKNK
jgi:hypothetical protein